MMRSKIKAVLLLICFSACSVCADSASDTKTTNTNKSTEKMTVEKCIEQALKTNPGLLEAESKVQQALNHLHIERRIVAVNVVGTFAEVEAAKKTLASAVELCKITETGYKRGEVVPKQDYETAKAHVAKCQAELEAKQKALLLLMGNVDLPANMFSFFSGSMAFSADGKTLAIADGKSIQMIDVISGKVTSRIDLPTTDSGTLDRQQAPDSLKLKVTSGKTRIPTALHEQIITALDKKVKVDGPLGKSVGEVIRSLLTKAEVDLLIRYQQADYLINEPLIVGEMALGLWLEMLIDSAAAEIRISLRDYGILMTPKDLTPEGAIPLIDYWKSYSKLFASPTTNKK